MQLKCPLCPAKVSHLRHHLRSQHHMNNSEERKIMLRLARGRVQLSDARCPECSIVYSSVRRHLKSGHKELTAKQVKTHIRELQLMVSVDQLKKLRAQNPAVPMVSHLDRPEERQESQVALPQPQPLESQVTLPEPPDECFHLPDPVSAVQEDAGSEGAPALQIQLQHARQTIEIQRQRILHLEDKVSSLTEERNYLRERLEDVLPFRRYLHVSQKTNRKHQKNR
ncbi:hypothetical protein QQF64_036384 [Cirrhinus molitorella]|uniref:C2H2-type domain-containing protein n=1 Tax=Cirrhinus molitorella TaxID=172907 RepID=A0ABR3NIF2_9TELE